MQVQKSRLFLCISMQLIWPLLREFFVTSHEHDRQIMKSSDQKTKNLKKTCHSHFLASYWSLGPCKENRGVRRENDDKRTGSACQVPVLALKELESESTIQTAASPVLSHTQHKGWARKQTHFRGKKNHCEQQKMLVVTKLGSWKKHFKLAVERRRN